MKHVATKEIVQHKAYYELENPMVKAADLQIRLKGDRKIHPNSYLFIFFMYICNDKQTL